MAGTNSAFDAEVFRSAIRSAMRMGLPNTLSEQATFQWKTTSNYTVQDPNHQPYSWSDPAVSDDAHADVQVLCAIDYGNRNDGEQGSPFGAVFNKKVKITLLDEEYALVEGADTVVLVGNTYDIDYVIKEALFEVDVVTMFATARDES